MRWSRAFVELVLHFAIRVAETGETPIEQALLTSTPLYLNFGLDRPFDLQHPVWKEFLAGYRQAADPLTWTHSFYLAYAQDYEAAPYGSFSYHNEPAARTIRFHFFGDRDASGLGPLSKEREQARRNELAAMFADIRRAVPGAEAVRGRSWLYNVPAYRRLFPPEYVQSATPVQPELQFMSLWGQFLDRSWELQPEPATIFRERATAASTLDAVLTSFPLSVVAPRCHVDHFYAFYGIDSDSAHRS